MNKEQEILKYSNPRIVFDKAVYIFGSDVDIRISNRKNKKYMLLDPTKNIYIHFGQMGYSDYTYTKDEYKRMKFRSRNKRWADQDVFTAGFLSYYLLW